MPGADHRLFDGGKACRRTNAFPASTEVENDDDEDPNKPGLFWVPTSTLSRAQNRQKSNSYKLLDANKMLPASTGSTKTIGYKALNTYQAPASVRFRHRHLPCRGGKRCAFSIPSPAARVFFTSHSGAAGTYAGLRAAPVSRLGRASPYHWLNLPLTSPATD